MRETLKRYVERAKAIQLTRDRLSQQEKDHQILSREELGVAEGDRISMDTLVAIFEKLDGSKIIERNIKNVG